MTRINLDYNPPDKLKEEDLRTINEMVEEEERGNVGWLNTDEVILRMVED